MFLIMSTQTSYLKIIKKSNCFCFEDKFTWWMILDVFLQSIIFLSILIHSMLSREDKKTLSSSFSKLYNPVNTEKNGSFSADKLTTLRSEQRGAEKNIVIKVLEGLNSQKDKNEVQWRINSFDQKRTISGFKARIEWLCRAKDMRLILKISFASSYFRLINHLNEGDIFVEIQELNFLLTNNEKKELQERIEKILINSIEIIRGKTYNDEIKKQSECLKRFLQDVNTQLHMKIYEGKKKSNEKVDKKLSKNYMLYPAPTTFAWNPLGSICITQNKYPLHKKTFYGEPNTLRKYFQSAQHEVGFNLREQEGSLQLSSQANNYEAIYDWKIEEDVELLIFNKESKKDEKYYQNRTKNELQSESKREEQKKEQDGINLIYLNRLTSTKLRRIYERYFGGGERTSQFNRHDKLRVYEVRSFNRDHEDDIVFIFEKMAMTEGNILQALFQNQLSCYPNILEEMSQFKYRLLSNILTQELTNPKLQFYIFLKIFILENQFIGGEMQRYFKQIYRILNCIPHHQLYFIGSYNHFDNIKSELLFMDLLQKILEMNENEEELTKVEHLEDGATIKLKKKIRLPKFNYESIVTQNEKNNFLMNLFPILIVKDREMEKFQFKQLKRIITANSKLFQFIKKMNEIISKFEEGRIGFIKSLIDNYKKYKQYDENEEAMALQSRRIFYVYCRYCQKANKLYDLAARDDLEFCAKCKQKLLIQAN